MSLQGLLSCIRHNDHNPRFSHLIVSGHNKTDVASWIRWDRHSAQGDLFEIV